MHVEQIITYLSIVLGIVLINMGIMRVLKQPTLISYILSGTIISLFLPSLIEANHSIEIFSTIGISFLLFIVGLELNPKILKELGKHALGIGLIQVVATAGLGFGLAKLLNFDSVIAIYLGLGVAFSSTIVILKLLSDKNSTETISSRLSIGILIVQDLIVMLMFIALSTIQQLKTGNGQEIALLLAGKIAGITTVTLLISRYILPFVTKKIAQSQEQLFLFSIGRCLILGTIFYTLGFSIEIGALVAGISLAGSPYKFEIMSKVKPLRDFFIVMFFVLLGSRIQFPVPSSAIVTIVAFVGFILIIKPLIILAIMKFGPHNKKNNFLTANNFGQISEFSFILIMMGVQFGHIKDPNLLSVMTIIGLLTITASSYQMLYADNIFNAIKNHPRIHRLIPGEKTITYNDTNPHYDILLFGYGRFGKALFETLNSKKDKNILVIDENPSIIDTLRQQNIPCVYGDAGEIDFLDEIHIKKSKMIISTIKQFDDTMTLIKTIKTQNPKTITIIISHNSDEALEFYKQGADYVVLPHSVGARHTGLLLEDLGFDPKKFIKEKENELQKLYNPQ